MNLEFYSFTIMSIFFLLAWIPTSVGKAQSFGMKWVASNRNPVKDKELPSWVARCERAHNNLKDNYPAFVAAVLALSFVGKFSQGTAIACVLYVIARVFHFASYGMGNVPLRAVSYISGLVANIYLLINVIL